MTVRELRQKLFEFDDQEQEVTVQTLSNSAANDGHLGDVIDVDADEISCFITVFVDENKKSSD